MEASRIHALDVANLLLSYKVPGEWFKRNLIMLVQATIVDNQPNGQLNCKMLHHLRDTTKTPITDWSKLVVDISRQKNHLTGQRMRVFSEVQFSYCRARENGEIKVGGFGRRHGRLPPVKKPGDEVHAKTGKDAPETSHQREKPHEDASLLIK